MIHYGHRPISLKPLAATFLGHNKPPTVIYTRPYAPVSYQLLACKVMLRLLYGAAKAFGRLFYFG